MKRLAHICITPQSILLNGEERVSLSGKQGTDMLQETYRKEVNDYPKYFKMDGLCKLGFLASELLLRSVDEERFVERDDRAVILFTRYGSIDADRHYQQTISDKENFFPSPSVFVYTLPNIVTGEIALRNHYHGETSLYVLAEHDYPFIEFITESAFTDPNTQSVLTGWVNYTDEQHFEVCLELIER